STDALNPISEISRVAGLRITCHRQLIIALLLTMLQLTSVTAAVQSGREIDPVILSKLMNLSVRPLAAEDFDGFINYWRGLSQAEIKRLGVAIDRLPSAARMRSDL